MTKPERLSFIASLCRKGRGTRIAVINALPSEVREETRLAKRHDDDESIIDEDVEVRTVSPALLAMVKAPSHAHHAALDECLTANEHKQLATDLVEYRKTHVREPSYSKRLWIVPANWFSDPFANMKRAEPVASAQTVGV